MRTLLLSLGLVVCLLILGLHLALLPAAQWQADDYIEAAFARDFGLRYLWQARIDGWSPRPLSETVLFVYDRLAASARRPFTLPFLLLLWAVFLAAPLAGQGRYHLKPHRLLLGLATACMMLLGHPVAEMFYWPAGAVAYLPTLAASTLALFLLLDRQGDADGRTGLLSLALLAGAASSEAGAFAGVLLAPVLAAFERGAGRALLLSLPTVALCAFVFWVLAHYRVAGHAETMLPGRTTDLPSALAGVPGLLLGDLGGAPVARLLFVVGFAWGWAALHPAPPSGRTRLRLLAFAVCLTLAAGLTLLASLLQLGTPCCERHDSLRQGWLVLALAAIAGAWRPVRPLLLRRLSPAILALACLTGAAPRLAPLLHDLRLLASIRRTEASNWRSGRGPGPAMVFRLPPAALVAGHIGLPRGRFHEPATDAWTAHGVMVFFDKQELMVQ